MTTASWNGKIIAASDHCVVVEGNRYFPPDAVKRELLRDSATESVCPWKGTARYYDVVVDGATNADAAWYYTDPKPAANGIKGFIAFWKGVKVED